MRAEAWGGIVTARFGMPVKGTGAWGSVESLAELGWEGKRAWVCTGATEWSSSGGADEAEIGAGAWGGIVTVRLGKSVKGTGAWGSVKSWAELG